MTTKTYPEKLKQIKHNMGLLAKAQPKIMSAFSSLHRAGTEAGALDAKTKELVALAIAVAARCDGCIAFHTSDAINAGASQAEITDVLSVAVMMGGGPSVVYATHAMEAMAQFIDN